MQPIAKALLSWYQQFGRHDLPWQHDPSAYRVWVSEIMLQQTQVATVIPYYQRFMRSFPSLATLAAASEDTVLAHWSGLGYYARARNLHKTAKIIMHDYQGVFPKTVALMQNLPGIGQSTAGAIISFSQRSYAVICDGNVRRVLARYCGIRNPKTDYWPLAEKFTPKKDAHLYNQAIMDLGATLCTRTKPRCPDCPLAKNCHAYQHGNPSDYPIKIDKKPRPVRKLTMLLIENKCGEILLIKRPAKGIWGGLWSFPECAMNEKKTEFQGITLKHLGDQDTLTHQFTHFTLLIYPVRFLLSKKLSGEGIYWHNLSKALPGGVAAPIATLLQQLQTVDASC